MPNNTLKPQTSLVMWLVNPLNQIKLERSRLKRISSYENENRRLKEQLKHERKKNKIYESCFRALEKGLLQSQNVTITNCQFGAYIERNEGVINSKSNYEKDKALNSE